MQMKATAAILAGVIFASAPAFAAVSDVTVNGHKITAAEQEHLIQGAVAQGNQRTPQLEENVKHALVAQEVLLEEAAKQKLETTDAAVRSALRQAKNNILSQAVIAKYMKAHPVTEAEVRAAYDREKAAYGATEYHVRHILVSSEADAEKVLQRLKSGEDFAKVAKDVSIDTGTKDNGGDLDWASPSSMVKPFGDAMKTQKVGAVSAKPVHSLFGWHILQVMESRPAELFPAFDRAKLQIEQNLTRERVNAYVDGLVAKAKIH